MVAFKEMSVGQRVKHLIDKEKLFSQSRLAELMGLSRATISEHLKKEGDLPTKYLTIICREYKVSPNWLLTGEGEPFKQQPTGNNISGVKIKGSGNATGHNAQAGTADLQAEIERLQLKVEHLTQRLKDKDEMIEILKMKGGNT